MGAWDYVSTLTLDTNEYDEQLNNAVKSTKKFQEQTEQTNKELGELRQEGGKAQSTFQDYAKKVGLSEKATLKMGKAINIATKSIAAVGVAIGVAKVAYEGWKVELRKTDQGVEKLEIHQLKVNNAIRLFKESLLTFDFSNFDSKLREINQSLEQMYFAFNKLNRMKMAGDANLAKNEMQREQLRTILDDKSIPANDQRKIQAAAQMKKLEQEAIGIANTQVELAQKALQKSLENAATSVRHDHNIFDEVTWHKNGEEQSYKPQFTQGLLGDIMSTLTDAKEYYKIINMSSEEVYELYRKLKDSGTLAQKKVKVSGTGYGGGYHSATVAARNSGYENVLIDYDQKLLDEYMKILTVRNMPIEQLEQYMNTLQYKYNLQTEIVGKNNQSMKERQQAEEDAAKVVADRVKAEAEAAKALKLSKEKEINATKEFIKKLLNADSKYTTQSGISISYDPISKNIEKLSDEQALAIESLYNSFETAIANIEEQFNHNDINSETYYKQVEHSLNILINAVKTISPDIAQALENSIMGMLPENSPIKKVDTELLFQQRNVARDTVNNMMNEMLNGSWSISDLSKDELKNYRNVNLNELYSQSLDKLLSINATGDGSQDFGIMSNHILGKSLEEQISILQEWEKIWGDFNNSLSENDPSYNILNEIGGHNFNSIYNALDILLYKYAAITEEQKRLQEQAEKMEGIAEFVNGIGNAFSAWSGVFDDATAQWINWVGTFISGIGEMLPHIQTLIAAKHAESLAEGTAGAAKVPFPGNIPAILSIIGIIGSIFASMPKFAGGGIFDGVTSMGDYNIARVNKGEMILNSTQQGRLFRMLNSGNPDHTSNVSGDVTFKIQGTQLVGVLNNYEKIHKRTL